MSVNSYIKIALYSEKIAPGIRTYPTRFYNALSFWATRNSVRSGVETGGHKEPASKLLLAGAWIHFVIHFVYE